MNRLTALLAVLLVYAFSVRLPADGSGSDSLITNGDFEAHTGAQPWPDHWEHPKVGASWVEEGGNHFLRLTATEPGKLTMLYRRVDIPADVRALKLTWRQRITDLKPGKQPWFDAPIMLEFKDAAGHKLKPAPRRPIPKRARTAGSIAAPNSWSQKKRGPWNSCLPSFKSKKARSISTTSC